MTAERARLRSHYDGLGAAQDDESWYEDPAFDDLTAMCGFEQAASVVEIGCGTGRLAHRLLERNLPSDAAYLGLDLSAEMVALTAVRIAPFGGRARVLHCDAVEGLPLPDHSVQRCLVTFVFDLLSPLEAHALLQEARRVLTPGGLLCAASLDHGRSLPQRLRSLGWGLVHRFAPLRVGGCRPVSLPELFCDGWSVEEYVRRNIDNCAVASICAQPLPNLWNEGKSINK